LKILTAVAAAGNEAENAISSDYYLLRGA